MKTLLLGLIVTVLALTTNPTASFDEATPSLVSAAAIPVETDPFVASLGWLAGCWESRSGDRVTLEMWSPPEGGLMVGASRTVVGGHARAFEHLRIHGDGERFVYTAIPSGQTETDFTSTSLDADGFTVENPEHDFPTRISYHREGSDHFTAIVQGPGENGEIEGFRVDYTRVSCEGQR